MYSTVPSSCPLCVSVYFSIMDYMYTFPPQCICCSLNPGLCEHQEGAREQEEGCSTGRRCVLLPRCLRASDTFSVITCRHVSMESRGFSHCFLSGLIWWMLSGTQHVSLETSWKSGGHWRHLKGLSEACLCCPGNVFHRGRRCFIQVFSLVSSFLFNISSCFAKLFF